MIEITNLNFRYGKQPNLFEGLSLSEDAGNIVGLLGKNGAGKSTLLKLLTGLLEAPIGSVNVMGENPIWRNPSFLEEVYFVPEEYDLPSVKIAEFVKANAKFYPRFDHSKMGKILSDFELNPENRLSKQSYGQRKKFLIAFALSTNCKLLVLDEPTNGLDIPSKAIFRKVVASSLSEDQLVFISTHQVKDVENLIDKIIILDQGKIIFHESLWEISEKVAFSTVTSLEGSQCLYHEIAPGGFNIMKPANGNTTEVDIELLFNATINGIKFN
ncbi:MAG TPA: ABC transporter ATP-binding protein [Prolixibacteraceae bacterium]|nr:ABC transporter ATP-binding protein [Prolixibacteraceae bacterium]